jgi:hypothetical protein
MQRTQWCMNVHNLTVHTHKETSGTMIPTHTFRSKTALTSLDPVPQPKPNAPRAPVTMIHVYLRGNHALRQGGEKKNPHTRGGAAKEGFLQNQKGMCDSKDGSKVFNHTFRPRCLLQASCFQSVLDLEDEVRVLHMHKDAQFSAEF